MYIKQQFRCLFQCKEQAVKKVSARTDNYLVVVEEQGGDAINITIQSAHGNPPPQTNIKMSPSPLAESKRGKLSHYTCSEAADLCGYKSVKSIYRAIDRGDLDCERVGENGHYLIKSASLHAYIEKNKTSDGLDLDDFIASRLSD